MGMIVYPVEELTKHIDHIIREEAAKPVFAARELQEEMEASLSEKLGIPVGHKEPLENAKQKRLENARKPAGSIIRMPGVTSSYHRDPITGKVVWDDLPLEYEFRKRKDLSQLVWNAVEEQEHRVFDVIQGGRSMGRNVKDIGKDLETLINYKDGGERVVGRWMGMFPDTEAGRRAGWERDYLKEHGNLQYGTKDAKALLKQPDAKAWIDQKMKETTKRGTPRLPDACRQYANRLGKAGLDYRAIRIARTETTAMVADEQEKIAENSDICTGEMDWVMERGRDAWNCNCEKYADMSPWKVDDPDRPEIPLHPNCMCEWRPRLKTDEEILAAFKEEMAEEMEIIEGTPEQQAMLDAIDTAEAELDKEMKDISSFLRGKPIDIDEALEGTNPGGYKENCQRCAATYELRRRGYNVEALPRTVHGSIDPIKLGTECFMKPLIIGHPNPNTPHFTSQSLIDHLSTFPDGARASVFYQITEGRGHVISCEVINGTPVFFDPQNNTHVSVNSLDIYKKFGFSRLDNLKIDPEFDITLISNRNYDKIKRNEIYNIKYKNEGDNMTLEKATKIFKASWAKTYNNPELYEVAVKSVKEVPIDMHLIEVEIKKKNNQPITDDDSPANEKEWYIYSDHSCMPVVIFEGQTQ
jgi:hypothetical protein